MKPEFFKDGSLQGWVTASVFTLLTMVLLATGFFIPKVTDAWIKMGGIYQNIYLWSLGIWFVYKGLKTFSFGGLTVQRENPK